MLILGFNSWFYIDTLKVKEVDIDVLEAKYQQSVFIANLNYKFRVLEMNCVVVNIDGTSVSFAKSISDSSVFGGYGKVYCMFLKKDYEMVKNLKIGDHVTLRGKVIDWIGFVAMKDCTLDIKYIKSQGGER